MKDKYERKDWLLIVQFLLLMFVQLPGFLNKAKAQQFNTDNYLTMSRGTTTVTMTAGGRNAGTILSFALIPKWEFFAQTYLFWQNDQELVPQHFNVQAYAKYMFRVNKQNNGGSLIFRIWQISRILAANGVFNNT